MRKIHELGYGNKSAITIKGNDKKVVDYKKTVGGMAKVVVSRFKANIPFGWTLTDKFEVTLCQ